MPTKNKQPPAAAKPAPLSIDQLAGQALASQARPSTIAAALTEDQRRELAATMTPEGLATPATAHVVQRAVLEFYESRKAVDGDYDQPPAPAEAAE